ncbi:unnamed protein product [Trichogramma brassicae]|uniref:Glucose-methanol-choline oxidoreductase N-terminal domain-containing protein n=1 Tax=Trichogramma brassicae TaxID=86971 RepID=A0A6H5J788_9HYME|nr:unnamed protein product [Trichogramma brassicae]
MCKKGFFIARNNFQNNSDEGGKLVYDYSHGALGTVESQRCCHCRFNDTAYINARCGRLMSFMTLLQALMMARCDIADPCRRAGTDALPQEQWFDFIVVGAGVAGPVIAKRLSDHPWWRVLLIEAAFNAINSSLDWQYTTEPTQPYPTACLENGGRCFWPRGKMVSGTSGMYGMMYMRGHPSTYDEWSKLGNPGWSYAEIEKYFERAENPVNRKHARNGMFKSTNSSGPMTIDYFTHKPAFADEVIRAADELGYKTAGLRQDRQTGFMIAPMLVQDGLRGTTSRYYLRPSAKNKNLYVLTNAHVTKVLTSEWDKRAYGVELIDKEGVKRVFKTNKEIILTAGAIGSPQILLQSGIGPRRDLQALGIPSVIDLPEVGRNLQNHVAVGIPMSIKDDFYETLSVDSVNEYVYNRSGPVASTGLTQLTAFLETSYANSPGVPDIQVFFDGFSSSCVRTGLDIECHDGTIGDCAERREIVIRPTLVNARSRGYLKLASNNPMDYPLIYPNYFTDEIDLKVLLEGVKKVIDLTKTKKMQEWDLKLKTKPHFMCSRHKFSSDAYWKCFIRARTGPENHQAGTCRMGPDGVVNHELRVHGIPNLRVADASIFPILTNANPVAPIVMVAEKASDMIYTKWMKDEKSPQ